MAILPNRDVGGGFRRGAAPAAPVDVKLFWSKNNNVDVFDSQ